MGRSRHGFRGEMASGGRLIEREALFHTIFPCQKPFNPAILIKEIQWRFGKLVSYSMFYFDPSMPPCFHKSIDFIDINRNGGWGRN
jgi:hypothetical protein